MPPKKSSPKHSRRSVNPVKNAKPKKRSSGKAGGKRSPGKLFEALVALQARLRAPKGCPWDREQTHDTLRTYLVEETYEVLDALDSGDPAELAGELKRSSSSKSSSTPR